jgi:ketosteroid isomerase-like protein
MDQDFGSLTRQYVAAFDAMDIDACAALFTDDFVLEDPAGRFAGKQTVVDYVKGLFDQQTEKLSFVADKIVVDPETASSVIEFTLKLGDTTLVGTDVIEWAGPRMKALRAYLYEKPGS